MYTIHTEIGSPMLFTTNALFVCSVLFIFRSIYAYICILLAVSLCAFFYFSPSRLISFFLSRLFDSISLGISMLYQPMFSVSTEHMNAHTIYLLNCLVGGSINPVPAAAAASTTTKHYKNFLLQFCAAANNISHFEA